jgi:hypothetical protein
MPIIFLLYADASLWYIPSPVAQLAPASVSVPVSFGNPPEYIRQVGLGQGFAQEVAGQKAEEVPAAGFVGGHKNQEGRFIRGSDVFRRRYADGVQRQENNIEGDAPGVSGFWRKGFT